MINLNLIILGAELITNYIKYLFKGQRLSYWIKIARQNYIIHVIIIKIL